MQLQRTVVTPAGPQQVFDYLSDFTTTTEWDPGTVVTTLIQGDGGVGTTYHNRSKSLGRESELTYTVTELAPLTRLALRGANKTVTAQDTMTMKPAGSGTEVTYTVDFEFKGVAKFVAPLLRPALKKLGDEAEEGLAEALGKLA